MYPVGRDLVLDLISIYMHSLVPSAELSTSRQTKVDRGRDRYGIMAITNSLRPMAPKRRC